MFVIVVIEGLLQNMLVTKVLKMEEHLGNLVTKESFEDSLYVKLLQETFFKALKRVWSLLLWYNRIIWSEWRDQNIYMTKKFRTQSSIYDWDFYQK